MIVDERTEMADALALNTGAAGTYNLGDVIDLHVAGIGHATGQNLTRYLDGEIYLVIRMASSATSGGAATGQFRVVSDDAATPSTTTASVHFTSAALPVASMTAGTLLLSMPLVGTFERYLGVQQITGTAAFTGGAVDVVLTNDPAMGRAYADNVG